MSSLGDTLQVASGRGRARLNIETRAARVARLRVVPTLQDRFSFLLNAVRAKVVQWLPVGFGCMKRVHEITGSRLVEKIAVQVAVKGLKLTQLMIERSQLEQQFRARSLRVSYLQSQLRHGSFDIRVSTALRLIEQGGDGFQRPSDAIRGASHVPCELRRLCESVEVNIQNIALLNESMAKANVPQRTPDVQGGVT